MDKCEKCDLCLWNQGSGGGGGGSSTLAGLTDVDISNPSDGQTLVYNAASRKWINGGSAGGVLIANVIEETSPANNAKSDGTRAPVTSTYRLDKTWQEIFDAKVCFSVAAFPIDDSPESPIELNIDPILMVQPPFESGDPYTVIGTNTTFVAETANDYPVKV